MKQNRKLIFLTTIVLCMRQFILIVDDGSNQNNSNDKIQIDTSEALRIPKPGKVDSSFSCNLNMIHSYGLSGQAKPNNVPPKFCPNVAQSCCSVEDDEATQLLWTTYRKKVEEQYNVFLGVLRYLLGYNVEGQKLASTYIGNNNEDCNRISNDYLELNMVPARAAEIYSNFVNSTKEMAILRKGFYCVMCDASFHQELSEYWSAGKDFSQTIYYSVQFCETLVEKTILSAFYMVTFVKRYIEDFMVLMNCKTGDSDKPQIKIDFLLRQGVKNCFYFRNKYFFFCQSYCKNFSLTTKSPIIDGDLPQLQNFFNKVKNTRTKAFADPANNIFVSSFDVVKLMFNSDEMFLSSNFNSAVNSNEFFKASDDAKLSISTFNSEVVLLDGINPWVSIENSKYDIVINSSDNILMTIWLSVFLLILR